MVICGIIWNPHFKYNKGGFGCNFAKTSYALMHSKTWGTFYIISFNIGMIITFMMAIVHQNKRVSHHISEKNEDNRNSATERVFNLAGTPI